MWLFTKNVLIYKVVAQVASVTTGEAPGPWSKAVVSTPLGALFVFPLTRVALFAPIRQNQLSLPPPCFDKANRVNRACDRLVTRFTK